MHNRAENEALTMCEKQQHRFSSKCFSCCEMLLHGLRNSPNSIGYFKGDGHVISKPCNVLRSENQQHGMWIGTEYPNEIVDVEYENW
jgi:hypothetical protein